MFDLNHFLKFNIAGRLLAVSETDIFTNISVKDFFLDSSGNLNVLFDDQSFQGFDYRKFDSNLNNVALEDEVFDQEAKKIAGSSVETLVPRLQCPDGTGPSIGLVAECLVDAPCPAGMQTELQYVFDLGFPFGEIPFSVSISTSSLTQACLSKTVPNCPQPTSPFQINVVTVAGITPVFACETDGVLQDVLVFVDKIFAMGQFGEIKEYTSDLAFVDTIVPVSQNLGGIDMDLDSNGNLFVLSQNKVHKFNDAAGPNPSSSFNLKENSASSGSRIVLDDNGNVSEITGALNFDGKVTLQTSKTSQFLKM